MRILTIADEPSRYYYDFFKRGILDEFDLIVACGDLPKKYLEFLVTMAHCPLIYVNGNHDESYVKDPPGGCICIDDDIYEYNGIRFLGLGGSYKYRDRMTYMYTEREMKRRIRKLHFKLWKHKGFDVLVTHAPAYSFGEDHIAHRGFKCFEDLMKKYKPQYMLHGHIHLNYGANIPRIYSFEDTTIINAYEYYKFDLEIEKKP